MEKKDERKSLDNSFFMKEKGGNSFREERRTQTGSYSQRGDRNSDNPSQERRSYNPNFDSNNRPKGFSNSRGDSNNSERGSYRGNKSQSEFAGDSSRPRRPRIKREAERVTPQSTWSENRESTPSSNSRSNDSYSDRGNSNYSRAPRREYTRDDSRDFNSDSSRDSSRSYNKGGYNRDNNSNYNNSRGSNRYGDDQNQRDNRFSNRTPREGGYNSNREGGYSANREGGYNSNSEGRYNQNREGGYNSNRREGDSRYGQRPSNNRGHSSFRNQPSTGRRTDKKFTHKSQEPYSAVPNLIGEIRLNRFVAMSGVCSRRDADEVIASGAITVNGEVVTELGVKVTLNDTVCHNGVQLQGEKLVYIVMNKPKNVVTTVEDPNAEKTVIDLLQGKVKERVFPVGRLDKNSMGVIILTNDGTLTKELTHPSFEKKKIYHVFLDKKVAEADMEKLAAGVELEDGLMYADELSYVYDNEQEVGIEIHSGKNRIVRRMFEHLGYKVLKLDRVFFAGLTKKGLKRGFWRYLTAQEVGRLKNRSTR